MAPVVSLSLSFVHVLFLVSWIFLSSVENQHTKDFTHLSRVFCIHTRTHMHAHAHDHRSYSVCRPCILFMPTVVPSGQGGGHQIGREAKTTVRTRKKKQSENLDKCLRCITSYTARAGHAYIYTRCAVVVVHPCPRPHVAAARQPTFLRCLLYRVLDTNRSRTSLHACLHVLDHDAGRERKTARGPGEERTKYVKRRKNIHKEYPHRISTKNISTGRR